MALLWPRVRKKDENVIQLFWSKQVSNHGGIVTKRSHISRACPNRPTNRLNQRFEFEFDTQNQTVRIFISVVFEKVSIPDTNLKIHRSFRGFLKNLSSPLP